MARLLMHRARRDAFRVYALQGFCGLLVALVFSLNRDWQAAYSAVFGMLICVIPNIVFAHRLYTQAGASQMKAVVARLYRAELYKIVLTVAMFYVTVRWLRPAFLPLLVAYIVTQMAFWFAPLLSKKRTVKPV